MSLEKRIRALEESTPGGYATYDGDNNIVVNSSLPALEWYRAACQLLSSRREGAKAELRAQLARSVRAADGGHLFELVAVFDRGPGE